MQYKKFDLPFFCHHKDFYDMIKDFSKYANIDKLQKIMFEKQVFAKEHFCLYCRVKITLFWIVFDRN